MPFIQTLDPTEIEALPEEKQGHGALQTEKGNLPLKAMDVKASVVGLLGKTQVRQTFVNTTREHLEATYIFPLPDRAGVSAFRLEVGERVVNGELQERAQARQNYTQAIQTGYRAAIAEEERPDVFTMRVGNIPPGEEVSIWLDMAGPLEASAGSASYRFPLVVAPRYIPGSGLLGASVGAGTAKDTDQVPDASRITPPTLLPGHASPVQLTFNLDVDPAGLQTSNHRSSMEVAAPFEIPGTIQLRPGQRLNQDFVFRFDFLSQEVQASLVIERDEPDGTEGTLMLTVVGPDQRGALPPKDVIFVLDRSGSMGGWKMIAARRACADLIDKLGPQDRFDVIAFDTVQESPFANDLMAEATPHSRYVATEWLSKIGARGGTEIARPLFYALKSMPADAEREQTIVLITDGQVGNDRGILATVEQSGFGGRIFTLGIDRSVSGGFLKSLAQAGDGRCELVESPERLDEVLDSFAKQIGGPFLEDMAFHVGGLCLDMDSVAPSSGHHLYPNVPTVVMARFVGLGELQHLKACISGVLPEIKGTETEVGILSTAWARQRIRELEDKWASCRGNGHDLEAKIVKTSLQHHVLCRFTAFVAIDKSEVVNKGGEQTEITQPVEHPAGWSGQTCGGIIMGQDAPHERAVWGMGGGTRSMMGGMGNVGGQSMGGGGTFCSASPTGQDPASYFVQTQGLTGPPPGVSAGFSGFAPGFDPMARTTRERKMSGKIPTSRSRGGGMRCVPIPALGGPPNDKERQTVLELVTKLLAWPKKKKKKFWKTMQELSDWLTRLSGAGEQMIISSKAVSPVLRSALNTAIAARTYTARTKQTLETIKSELEVVLDPKQAGQPRPRNEAFWK